MKKWKLPAGLGLFLGLLALLSAMAARLNPAVTLCREKVPFFDSDEASVSPEETVTTTLHLGPRFRQLTCWLGAASLAATALSALCRMRSEDFSGPQD